MTSAYLLGQQRLDMSQTAPYPKDLIDYHGQPSPQMMFMGLSCHPLVRPVRFRILSKFLDYVQSHDQVWMYRLGDITAHLKKRMDIGLLIFAGMIPIIDHSFYADFPK